MSFAYALFVVFFPWEEISKQEAWRDFTGYVEYLSSDISPRIEREGIDTLLGYFTSEVAWDEIMRWLTATVGSAAVALRISSFFICFVWGAFLFSRMPVRWALVFLLNPLSIDVVMSGIRNGFAWSLIILGLASSSHLAKLPMFGIAPFVHSSSAGLLSLIAVAKIVMAKIKSTIPLIVLPIASGAILGLALTIGNELVVGALRDRRVGDSYVQGGGSVLQASFWAILLLVQLASGKAYCRKHAIVTGLLAWYLTMNFFIPWSYRIWAAFIPVIAFAIWDLPAGKRRFILYLWLGYLVLWYAYWSKLFDVWYPMLAS